MFSYYTAVYGLKQNCRFQESSVIELFNLRNIIIFQHDVIEGEGSCCCSGLHYHALFELLTAFEFNSDPIIKAIKNLCCYFCSQDCFDPADYFGHVKKYGMKHVFTKICEPSDLDNYEWKKFQVAKIEGIHRTPFLSSITTKSASIQESILDSCKAFHSGSLSNIDYLAPYESTTYVHDWCMYQNIDPVGFVEGWINCLDRKLEGKNTLYFQGVENSCIQFILESVMEVCEPFVGKVLQGTTGYVYFWKLCVDKRIIVLFEPHFGRFNYRDQMLEILEGTSSNIKISDNVSACILPTPVVIIAREQGWENERKLEFDIKNRLLKCYSNLKEFRPPNRKLHPLWLILFTEKYLCHVNGLVDNKSLIGTRVQKSKVEVENEKRILELGNLNVSHNTTCSTLDQYQTMRPICNTTDRENLLESTTLLEEYHRISNSQEFSNRDNSDHGIRNLPMPYVDQYETCSSTSLSDYDGRPLIIDVPSTSQEENREISLACNEVGRHKQEEKDSIRRANDYQLERSYLPVPSSPKKDDAGAFSNCSAVRQSEDQVSRGTGTKAHRIQRRNYPVASGTENENLEDSPRHNGYEHSEHRVAGEKVKVEKDHRVKVKNSACSVSKNYYVDASPGCSRDGKRKRRNSNKGLSEIQRTKEHMEVKNSVSPRSKKKRKSSHRMQGIGHHDQRGPFENEEKENTIRISDDFEAELANHYLPQARNSPVPSCEEAVPEARNVAHYGQNVAAGTVPEARKNPVEESISAKKKIYKIWKDSFHEKESKTE